MTPRQRPAYTLVEMLVTVAIIAILIGMMTVYLGGKQGTKKGVESPRGRARTVACQNNLNQLAMAMRMAADTEEHAPQDIRAALKNGATEEMLRCPETHQPYRYDPQAGTISCVTPGHEGLTVNINSGR